MSENQRMVELLEELVKCKRFEGAQLAKKILRELLSKDAEKIVYQYSDGRGSKDIADLAGVSDFSVRSYWKKWNIEGLVIPTEKHKGRYEKVFSLEDFGIEIPLTKIAPEANKEQSQTTENIIQYLIKLQLKQKFLKLLFALVEWLLVQVVKFLHVLVVIL